MEGKTKSPYLMILFLSFILPTKTLASSTSVPPTAPDNDDRPRIAKPHCNESCGGVSIPYPFGIGENCAHNPLFTITCSTYIHPPTPLLANLMWSKLYIEQVRFYSPPPYSSLPQGEKVTQISFGDASTNNSISITGSFDKLEFHGENLYGRKALNMSGKPFRLMGNARNSLLVGGCSGGAVVVRDKVNNTIAGCAIACIKNANVVVSAPAKGKNNMTCYGLECCQSAILTSQDFFEMDFVNFLGENVSEAVTAVVVDTSYLEQWYVDRSLSAFGQAPTTLQWKVDHLPVKSSSYANSLCVKESEDEGYICRCKHDYQHGNPYLPNGCQAIKACRLCPDNCISAENNTFYCPSLHLPPPPPSPHLPQGLVIGLGISLGSMALLIAVFIMYQFLEKRKEVKKKEKNFKKNGGLLLQQEMRTGDGSIERTKLFSSHDLVKATDNFNENRVLGRGGQGIVYKGMLVDGAIVAVKKSKKVSERQLQQFINEVVILSQVNHRNVVKLYGCCLETDVPLLVYEYVPNGTLYQHLHNPYEDFRITWKMRLQIAADSAEALAYLHSWSFSPIYHRDIKTSNILLDGKYKAKVSDFGTSKTLSLGQTHVTTHVQGTIGYMDPEFIQSNLFTEKSDVYSFGIVLLELLTSKKPVYLDDFEEPTRLASEFISAIENSRLHDIVDDHVLEEAREQEIESVVALASKCLNLNGKERPTMKEVAVALHIISSQNPVLNTSQQDFITRDEVLIDQTYSPSGSSLTISSTYGPR